MRLATFEQVEQILWRVEVRKRPADIGRAAQVAEPGTGLFCELFDKGAAVTGECKGHAEVTAFAIAPRLRFASLQPRLQVLGAVFELAGIALSLWNTISNIDAFTFGFDDGYGCKSGEQHVIGTSFWAACRPLGDRLVFAFLGACAFAVSEVQGICVPTSIDQLLVDQNAGEVFREIKAAAGLLGFFGHLLTSQRLCGQLLLQCFEAFFMLGAHLLQSVFVLCG